MVQLKSIEVFRIQIPHILLHWMEGDSVSVCHFISSLFLAREC